MVRSISIVAFFGGLMIACGDGATAPTPAVLRVVTDQATYTVGDTGEVRILNVSGSAVPYNECDRSLDRYVEGKWVDVPWRAAVDQNCVDILRSLAAGAEISVAFRLLDTLGSGTYRWRFNEILTDDARTQLPLWERVSTPFLVAP